MSRQKPNRIRIGLFFFAFFFVIGGSAWYFSGAVRNLLTPLSERYRLEGDALLEEGHLAEAVLTYRQAVEADGENLKALSSLAAVYEQQGRLRMAERYRARAEKREPVYRLPAVQAESGMTPVWITPISEAPPLGGVVTGDRLITSHEDGTVAAVDVETGKVIWSIRLPAAATSAPAVDQQRIDNGIATVGAADGNLYALSLLDGHVIWQAPTGGPIYAPVLFRDGIVYCPSSSGAVLAVRAADGSVLWKKDLGSPMNGMPAAGDDILYLGSNNGRIYALHSQDGSLAWPDGILTSGAVESQPYVTGNRVIFGSGDGRVYALDTSSGGQYWRYSTPDSVYAAPLVLAERTFIASSGRSLSAVDTLSGKRLWQTMLPAPLRDSPVPAVSYLYQIGDGDANLYVVRQDTGELVAAVPTGDWLAAGPWLVSTKDKGLMLLLGKDGAAAAFKGSFPE